jgi:hypothetical protein
MKKIKSIYVREIGEVETGFMDVANRRITYNSKTNTYHQGNTEYKGEHIISVTYE